MIDVKKINKSYSNKKILKDINLNFSYGKINFIIGKSGSGKTVLSKIIVALEKPDSGAVLLDGKDIHSLKKSELLQIRKKISYVFQESSLFDSMTLKENIILALRNHNYKKEEKEKIVNTYIKELNLEKYKNEKPYNLSFAIQKKTAIARALVTNPKTIIYDEPTTGLSFKDARLIDNLILNMSDKFNITPIVISHDLHSIFTIAEEITMLDNGEIIISSNKKDFIKSDNKKIKEIISLWNKIKR